MVERLMAMVLLATLATGCGGSASPARQVADPGPGLESPVADQARAGVDDAGLQALLVEHWDWTLRQSPEWATTLGDHRFDAEIRDPSHAAVGAAVAARKALLARAQSLDAASMGATDRVTLQLLVEQLEHRIGLAACQVQLWNVTANGNPVSTWSYLPKRHPIKSLQDADNLLARYRKIPAAVDASIANLRLGKSRALLGNRASIERTLQLVTGQLEAPVSEWALMAPAKAPHPSLTAAQRASFAAALKAVVQGEIKAAFLRYRDLLTRELLPVARGKDAQGLVALPLGRACYGARIRYYTGLDQTAQALHQLGLAELTRINGEMRALGGKLFGIDGLPAMLAHLRTERSLYFADADAVLAKARASLAAAKAAMPAYFGILPGADCVVSAIPDYQAPYTTIAYYREPHADGSKPGEYFVNAYAPETRPIFEAQVLAYHEAIPGHHLQIAISQERPALPAFRRHGGLTAFVEGWALYSERLADEMGLYTTDLDRMGMLSYDAWRASRLVVDTGIHAFGWTRERAERFMMEHTALAENNIRNEVDRYIGTPGQALAYKVGQLEILRLRADAEKELGELFDLRAFHDAVLSRGAVSLAVLAAQVKAWVAERRSSR